MLLTVDTFKSRVQTDMDNLVRELQEITGRSGSNEEHAWRSSLPKVATAFSAPAFAPLHLYFGSRGHLSLEYQLPAAASWCDMVLLGRHADAPAAVIVELKDWLTRADKPGAAEGLMMRQGAHAQHPSEQVKGYTEYCRRFHSVVHDYEAEVHGCVLFTKDMYCQSYQIPPNESLAKQYPCFTIAQQDIDHALPAYFSTCLTEPDEDFAKSFEHGVYRQSRGFVRQIGEQILKPGQSPFELLDNQRTAFSLCTMHINEAVFSDSGMPKKKVILIYGPPGSGKSVVAAKLWAHLVTDKRMPEGSVVVTTTSQSQNSNWSYLFNETTAGAAGIIKKATGYTPVTTYRLGQLRKRHGDDFCTGTADWRKHLKTIRALGEPFRDGAMDDQYLVSIVDESHALINPEHPGVAGQFGFATSLGPQVYHIIRSSVVSIFLMDAPQGYRDRENTTINDVKGWARELNAEVADEISLAGSQFRCAGSREFVDWVDALLRGDPPSITHTLATAWLQLLDFKILDNPKELENALRSRVDDGDSARLLASYARPWKTQGTVSPHDLPGHMQDFCEPYEEAGKTCYWNKVWNHVPGKGNDYTYYIQARPGFPMHDDPLCEVGCPYAVRGFDFDYVGLLWFSDLLIQNGTWQADPAHVHESGVKKTKQAANRETDPSGPAHERLREAIAQAYRILMTRPMKGLYIWFEDSETRAFVEAALPAQSNERPPGPVTYPLHTAFSVGNRVAEDD